MTNQLFEKAKQAVAEKWKRQGKIAESLDDMWGFYQEAAEWMCNEAVKDDREWIKDNFESLVFLVEELRDGEFQDVPKFAGINRPLPFPQQPDER